MAENFPNLKKKTYADIGSPEGPKQDEPKQTYTYNKTGKLKRILKAARKKKLITKEQLPLPHKDIS